MFKKILSSFLCLLLFFYNSIAINTIYAASNITTTSLNLNGVSGDLQLNPGTPFRVNLAGKNLGTDTLTNVYAKLYFSDNNIFSFLGLSKTLIQLTTTNSDVSLLDYNTTTGLSTLVTTRVLPSLAVNSQITFAPNPGTANNFIVSTGTTTYRNSINFKLTATDSLSNNIESNIFSRTIFVNVKPHITDYYFSKSSIIGNGSDSSDLIVKVKDYNGCTNIDGGMVTADLSSLGLSNNENLNYVSCDVDGKTAIFKKIGITTLSSAGDKIFTYSNFSAKDENNNTSNPNDLNTTFDDEDKKTDLVLTIATPNAPVVTISSINPSSVSSQTSTLNFSATQTGTYKAVINGDGSCSAGTIISDWQNYDGTGLNISISPSNLNDGANTIYVCVKNSVGDIGSANTILTKDLVLPTISNIVTSPRSVTTANSRVSFTCNENGYYKAVINGNDSGYQSTTANTTNNVTLNNAWLALGINTVSVYCKDIAGNEQVGTSSITKVLPTPAMTSSGLTLTDGDNQWDGVNGRDLKVTWDTSIATSFAGFESYRIYVLPENTAFSTGYTYVGLVNSATTDTWTGTYTITNDSAGNPLAGGNYIAYVAIMGTSGELGTPASATGTLVADIVPHPSVLSAAFTATGILSVKFDAGLRTDLSNYTATGYVYTINGTTYTGTSINSVVNDTVNVNIADLGSTSLTGTVNVYTGAAWGIPVDGSYNNVGLNIPIIDTVKPNISVFSTGTTSYYQNFYSGSLIFNYSVSEQLKAGGASKIEFTRVGGNSDTTKYYYLTNASDLTIGNHSISIDMANLGLIAGAYYDVKLIASDLNSNSSTSNALNIKFDNIGPSIVTINPFGPQKVLGVINPTFTWLSTSDNSGNGSGVKGYKLRIYTGDTTYTSRHTCTGAYNEYNITNLSNLSYQVNLANLYNYAWAVTAYDNMENIGTSSSCDNFYINNLVPGFSNESITDTVLNSTSYTKGGNNLIIKSTITNTNSSNIWLNASSIKDSSYANINCASPVSGVTCTYASNIATYTFSAGASAALSSSVKQVQFTAANTSGINTGTTLTSITLDNTIPTAPTISTPTNSIYGGNSLSVNFSTASDNIGINYLKYEYSSDGGTNWNNIGTGVNVSPYNWDISSLSSGNNYKLRITAYDMVGNTSSTTSSTFSIDKITPTVPSNTITYPSNSGIKVKGGDNMNITWNAGGISDNIGLAANPITLYFSIDGGTNYTQIATNEANDGTYTWTIPSLNNSTMKIKVEAVDNVGNKSSDISDNNFEIDSTTPVVTVTYAGNGGSTPQTNKYVNNSGIDITANISDANLNGGIASYSFFDQTSSLYWNGSSYVASPTYINLANINTSNYSLANTINPSITNGHTYKLTLRANDVVGNTYTTTQITYFGDTINPSPVIDNNTITYSSGIVNIAGTSSDNLSGISSVKLEITNGSDYFDGTNFASGITQLATNTSDSYANWSYNFTIPGIIADGTNMQVKAIAYDKAYKTANSGNTIINIIKDTTGPQINTGVITYPSLGSSFRGGQNINITWNTGAISDAVSGLATNSIKLEYFDGTNWQTIANSLANNGIYNWTIPTIDYTNVKIRITAKDNVGIETSALSDGFLVDSLPPSITSVETMDNDTNGQIDGILVNFSENIKDISLNLSKFSVSGGINITGTGTAGINDDDKLVLYFSNTGTTDTTPTLTYQDGGVTDYVGNNLVAGSMLSNDKVVPRVQSANIFDNDSNGKLDKIELNFSEALTSTSVNNGWTINNAYAGMSIASVSVISSKITINLNESTDFNTATGNLSISLNNSIYSDLAGNLAGNLTNYSLADKAAPVYLSSTTIDSNANYKSDKINVQFSEAINNVNLSDFALSYLSTGSSINSVSGTGTDTLSINLGETSLDYDTDYKPDLVYSGTSLKDFANNQTTIFTKTVKDGINPKIISKETYDSNNNGKADTLRINFSETLNYDVSATNISVSGYSVNSYSTGTKYIQANLGEKDLIDTVSSLDSKISSNTSLGDLDANLVNIEGNYSSSTDKMGPIISFARFDSVDKIYLNFSENVTNVSLANSDFVLNGSSSSIISVNFVSGTDSAVLTISGNDITYGVTSISFAANIATDSNSNTVNSNVFTRISPSVIINEVMYSNNTANQYIELKNNSNVAVSLSGWIIENASGNGTSNLILPSGASIAANSYYLITSESVANSILSGGIIPDYTTNSLSLNTTSQNNLALTNELAIVYDYALANPWAAGDSTNNYSMERKEIPGNGSIGTNWYTAVASIGFDDINPRGTPRTINKVDINAPTISAYSPSENTLFPIGDNISLSFDYSDDISGIDTGSTNLVIEKYNGTSFDMLSGMISSSNIQTANSTYNLAHLDFGKYRVAFEISDKAGNQTTQIINFYVDKVEFIVSTGSIDLGNIRANTDNYAQVEETVTVKTLGAGIHLYTGKDTMLTKGLTDIPDYNGTYGFGFDLYKNENGSIIDYSSNIQQINNTLLGNIPKDILTSNGSQKTYTYKLKYYLKVEDIQASGNYSTNANYSLILDY